VGRPPCRSYRRSARRLGQSLEGMTASARKQGPRQVSTAGLAVAFLAVASGAALFGSVAGFLGRHWWVLDLFSHFPVQYLAACVGLGAIWLALKRYKLASALLQAEWLAETIRLPEFRNAPFRIVFCHIPPDPIRQTNALQHHRTIS
jgi:hypothetical protein